MFDWLKGKALGVPDAFNRRVHPFFDWSRDPIIRDSTPLKTKASIAWGQVQMKFMFGKSREFYFNTLPSDGGDHAFHQGWCTMTAVLRGDESSLSRLLEGHEKLQTLGGDHRLARGADVVDGKMKVGDSSRRYQYDKGYVFHQNCSESSLVGQNVGLWSVLKWLPGTIHADRATWLIRELADQILKDNWRLLDSEDGRPADHGDLRPLHWPWQVGKRKPAGLGAGVCTMLLAYKATGHKRFREAYTQMWRKHYGLLSHQETHMGPMHPWYQDVLAYANYSIVLSMDDFNPRARQGASTGLKNLWARTNHEGNSLYIYLTRMVLPGIVEDRYLENAVTILKEFSLRDDLWNAKGRGSPESSQKEFFAKHPSWPIKKEWGLLFKKRGPMSRIPLPAWARPGFDFAWQREPYTLAGWSDFDHNFMDLCLAEALGRKIGEIDG